MERIHELSGDLARELLRKQGDTATARSMADTIKQDIIVVLRELKASKR